MKIKKLLPILSVASATAIVAPIVASCGKTTTFEYNVAQKDEWNVPQIKTQYATHNFVDTDTYLTDANKNNEILSYDFVSSIPDELLSGLRKITYQINDINVKESRISFKIEFNGDGSGPFGANRYINVQNMQFILSYYVEHEETGYDQGWYFEPFVLFIMGGSRQRTDDQIDYLKADPYWSITIQEDSKSSTFSRSSQRSELRKFLIDYVDNYSWFSFKSHYFSGVTYIPD